jgi:hypothetical protein
MANRSKKHHRKNHRKNHRKTRRNLLSKTLDNSVSLVKSSSKKYMPKVKQGLENVGAKVTTTASNSVPYLQRMTRNFFNMFSQNKTKKR